MKSQLLSTTLIPAFVGAGMFIASSTLPTGTAQAASSATSSALSAPLPTAKPRPRTIQLAASTNPCNPCGAKNPCNPCAAKNPCNPCAAKNPCNPCGAKNPCNPCGAKKAAYSSSCFIPSLRKANPCNPCAAKNPCNPCAAKNPCNPCAAKNPCNPCAAKNPCNPCAATNPCNPCAAKNPCNPCAAKNPCNPCAASNPCAAQEIPEVTPAEATAAYNCLNNEMAAGYAKSKLKSVAGYEKWASVNTSPYQSATHGNRYVNNYANDVSASRYKKFEQAGVMPKGSVLAKDSFVIKNDGAVAPGPLFVMEKMNKGYNKNSGDWKFTIIMPDGMVPGTTKGKGMDMQFCVDCHVSVTPEQDYIMFLPEEFRK